MKHYVVSLVKGYDKSEILDELNRDTTSDSWVDSNIIPDRPVDNVNTRPSSGRIFEVELSDAEAEALMKDPRVGGVNEPLVWDDEWADYQQELSNQRDGTSTARDNWAFSRHVNESNPWGSNVTSDIGGTYDYHLDGTGVDYVHQESKFRYDHEQWQDRNGNSRLQRFQWNTLPNMGGEASQNYDDVNFSSYHATHCCGTAVGKDYGWAKNANIYCLDMDTISSSAWFDAIKEFHKAKTPDPITGVKRPTIVGASWGYKANFTSITGIVFRGSSVGTVKSSQYGMIGDVSNRFNANLYNLNVEVEEMEEAGVIYVKSAGNQGQKLCSVGDIDYDNYITRSITTGGILAGSPIYYNRGAGNIGPNTIVCGNLDSTLYNGEEATQTSSDKGPRVDVWVAGTNIVSAYNSSSTSIANYTGTSMSTPQISGMTCLLLQLNPGWTPAQARQWWHNQGSIKGLMFQGETDESNAATFFSNTRSLYNGVNRIAYFPFAGHRALRQD